MDSKITFGSFLTDKRMEQELSARQLANVLGISAVYMCDIEKDRRPAPADMLKNLPRILQLAIENG